MKALCQHMQTNCIFNNHTVDVVITALKLKYYDAIIPGIDITPERQKQVAFTQSYYSYYYRQERSLYFIRRNERITCWNGKWHDPSIISVTPLSRHKIDTLMTMTNMLF